MLNVYFEGIPKDLVADEDIIWDVELEFAKCRLTGDSVEAKILAEIEEGKYCDALSFIDRFGYKLPISALSTGCKAALVVLNNPDKVVSLYECRLDARDAILNYCREGTVILNSDTTLVDELCEDVDVSLEGVRCFTISDVNRVFSRR